VVEPRSEETRRRVRRFGVILVVVVLALVGFTIGYVQLYGRVLRDPSMPPTVTSPTNPRVRRFEIGLVAGAAAAVVAIVLIRRSRRVGASQDSQDGRNGRDSRDRGEGSSSP